MIYLYIFIIKSILYFEEQEFEQNLEPFSSSFFLSILALHCKHRPLLGCSLILDSSLHSSEQNLVPLAGPSKFLLQLEQMQG